MGTLRIREKIISIEMGCFVTLYKQIIYSENNPTIDFNQWKAKMENKIVNEGDSLISFSFNDVFANSFEKER